MKQLKALLLVMAITLSSVTFASTNPEDLKNESALVTSKVEKLLKNPKFRIENEITASVMLTLNKDNEMVVLSVDSDNEQIKSFIKARLNYKKLDETFKSLGDKFIVPVRVTAEE